MKATLHLKSAIIAWIRGPTRCQGLALLFVPVLFACFALSQTTQAVNPAPGSSATSESLGASDGPQNFSNTALLRSAPTITTFDVPGAGTGPGQGTQGIHINPAGAITGYYLDLGDVFHGYVRTLDGTFATFDAPGAGTGPFEGTLAFSINPAGATTGIVRDANIVRHGFVRAPNGAITTFDAPGAGTGPLQGTRGININPTGTIAGYFTDANDVNHGLVRASNGAITTFDAPGAGTGPGQGTRTEAAACINPAGAIVGFYTDASDVLHGYVRVPGGTITTFDAPGAGTGPGQGTLPASNNPAGTITGSYIDATDVNHGFLRTQ